ncbi:MAG: phage terminase large subunit [Rikenellaceae bacterium]|jgi:predicted phage terminase large subunit-like protein|nr:phage terminase large subunit [Rikenellaceae bacterium]
MAENITFVDFARRIQPSLKPGAFHANYYRILEAFARSRITKLIVTMPPQHGKSVGASVLLPAYMLGLNPDLKIAIASYNATLASRFNRRVQRIIESGEYRDVFPATTIKVAGGKSNYIRRADQVEIVGASGELLSVGRDGPLTGNQVDVFILDDLYKNALEADSPVVRDNCWEWYTSVVKSRMHNDSAELIVFTRWHEEDLIGMLETREKVVELRSWEQLEQADGDCWYKLNLEAIKDSSRSEIDPRRKGEALWEERHGKALLVRKRRLDPHGLEAIYQGRPSSKEGLLYGDNFRTWRSLPSGLLRRANYTDTADTGDDYLCSVCYVVVADGMAYVVDVVYSQQRMEVTEDLVARMIAENDIREAMVESNNGGRGFARAIDARLPQVQVGWFHQGANKEARILSNSATVLRTIVMPHDWAARWEEFHRHLTTYRRLYRSNRWHDAPDVLTASSKKSSPAPKPESR